MGWGRGAERAAAAWGAAQGGGAAAGGAAAALGRAAGAEAAPGAVAATRGATVGRSGGVGPKAAPPPRAVERAPTGEGGPAWDAPAQARLLGLSHAATPPVPALSPAPAPSGNCRATNCGSSLRAALRGKEVWAAARASVASAVGGPRAARATSTGAAPCVARGSWSGAPHAAAGRLPAP